MAYTDTERERVLAFYDGMSAWIKPAVVIFGGDAAAILREGRERLGGMLDEIPYADRPDHTMAAAMFSCAGMLALFEVLRAKGVDAHAWGGALHALPPPPEPDSQAETYSADAAASQKDAAPNEFVFEMVEPDANTDYGMNVTSCAICHLFGRHDAMDLVPYMCAYDDLMSGASGSGLRRSGTIALGASRCDFRFKPGGQPLRLVDQYPDKVRLGDDS